MSTLHFGVRDNPFGLLTLESLPDRESWTSSLQFSFINWLHQGVYSVLRVISVVFLCVCCVILLRYRCDIHVNR